METSGIFLPQEYWGRGDFFRNPYARYPTQVFISNILDLHSILCTVNLRKLKYSLYFTYFESMRTVFFEFLIA